MHHTLIQRGCERRRDKNKKEGRETDRHTHTHRERERECSLKMHISIVQNSVSQFQSVRMPAWLSKECGLYCQMSPFVYVVKTCPPAPRVCVERVDALVPLCVYVCMCGQVCHFVHVCVCVCRKGVGPSVHLCVCVCVCVCVNVCAGVSSVCLCMRACRCAGT